MSNNNNNNNKDDGMQDGLASIQKQIALIQKVMQEEYDKIKREWDFYAREKEEMDRIKASISGAVIKPGARLKLNVGGTRFEIRMTCVQDNEYFRALYSETFAPQDKDGFFFIDRDPDFMHVVLGYLRTRTVQLSRYSEAELQAIRDDADFYMVYDLVTVIDEQRKRALSSKGITTVAVNGSRAVSNAFNGIFFELHVKRSNFKLHGVAFVAGERRKIVGEVYLREGRLKDPGGVRKISDIEQQTERGELVVVNNFTAIPLAKGYYTLGIYSVSCATAIAVCPRKESVLSNLSDAFSIEESYHVANQKGNLGQREGENQYDFSGELFVSF